MSWKRHRQSVRLERQAGCKLMALGVGKRLPPHAALGRWAFWLLKSTGGHFLSAHRREREREREGREEERRESVCVSVCVSEREREGEREGREGGHSPPHTHTHTHAHTRTHTHTRTHAHAHPHTHTPTHAPTHTHTHVSNRSMLHVVEPEALALFWFGASTTRHFSSAKIGEQHHTFSKLGMFWSFLQPKTTKQTTQRWHRELWCWCWCWLQCLRAQAWHK